MDTAHQGCPEQQPAPLDQGELNAIKERKEISGLSPRILKYHNLST